MVVTEYKYNYHGENDENGKNLIVSHGENVSNMLFVPLLLQFLDSGNLKC